MNTPLIKRGLLTLLVLFSLKSFSQKNDAEVGIETKVEEKVYTIVEKMPEYPGGREAMIRYFRSNLVYPEKSKKEGIEGKVIINFSIDKKGKVINVKVKQSVAEDIDAEAIKLIKNMPIWSPGTQDGIPVVVSFNFPINFALPKK